MAMPTDFSPFRYSERAIEIKQPVYADFVIDTLLAWRHTGLQTCLVTLVELVGSSPRPVGSQLAVASDGRAVGAVTGGCAEQAIILDAMAAMARGQNHLELYGRGSRFKDLTLPCGSGAYLYFDVTISDATLQTIVKSRRERKTTIYNCEGPNGPFERSYNPQFRLVVFGRGNILPYLAQMSHLAEFDTWVFCPDEWTRDLCAPYSAPYPMTSATNWDQEIVDRHTAIVSLFHEHAYEYEILDCALGSQAFFIGALGSRRTHAMRCDQLRAAGWSDAEARIQGPVGLDIGAQTPPEIAISIMAQIVAHTRLPTNCRQRAEA